jgi:hypothetical protein
MQNKKIIILIFVCCLLVTPSEGFADNKQDSQVAKLKWLDTANPIEDAQRALEKHDIRLKAVYGYALTVPGINDKEKYSIYENKFGFDPIDGASDNLQSEEHSRLNQRAYDYALKYNSVILKNVPK